MRTTTAPRRLDGLGHDRLRRDVGARRSRPARSTSARASPTPTGRPRSPRPRSRRSAPASTSTRPARASRTCGRPSPSTSSASTGSTLDPDTEVVVTTGATEAVAAALLGLVDPGDEVVALEPFYDSYAAVHRDGRRRAGAGDAARTRLPARRRPAARRGHRAHPADPAQHAAQPDRHGAHAATSCRRSPTLARRARPASWSPTRSTSTWRTTVAHVPLADAARACASAP